MRLVIKRVRVLVLLFVPKDMRFMQRGVSGMEVSKVVMRDSLFERKI